MDFEPSKITKENMASMKELGLVFDTSLSDGKAFGMSNVLSMDLETCSVANSGGRFMVYAVGFFTNQLATSA